MGYDTGTDPDTSGTSAVRLRDEYPAKCQPDNDRSGSAGVYDSWGDHECDLLSLYEQEKRKLNNEVCEYFKEHFSQCG